MVKLRLWVNEPEAQSRTPGNLAQGFWRPHFYTFWFPNSVWYVFSANGASSLEAWGIAPGLWIESLNSAEGATQTPD
jgi:hypothetical protein